MRRSSSAVPSSGRAARAVLAALVVAACGRAAGDAPRDAAGGRDHLFVWTRSADTTQADFLAVLDVTEPADDTARYGRLVTTLPVPGLQNVPHHTEHEMPADGQLFANGFATGRSFVFDLRDPAAPRIAAEFGEVDGYSHPHSFLRMPDGHVLATFQMQHAADGTMRAGGLVEMTPDGQRVRSVSADVPGARCSSRPSAAASSCSRGSTAPVRRRARSRHSPARTTRTARFPSSWGTTTWSRSRRGARWSCSMSPTPPHRAR